MTEITFSFCSKQIHAVDLRGHAGYAAEGEDIVCAAISSAIMLTHALLYDVQKLPIDTIIEDEGAHIRITLPAAQINDGQQGLQALRLHLKELEENYPDYMNVMEVYTDVED